ncbi:hypothetical protein FRB99_000902 [Tulasnella sp. 403]|nr:hypothetical protein FRB99_000902 [Tulasnella sp. 403]
MPAPHTEKSASRLQVLGTVSFYLVAAIAMVMANKWVLNKTDVPLFFLFTQLVIAVVLFAALHSSGYIFRIPDRPLDSTLIKGLAPMVFMNVLNLNLNNFTLKYVDASFYQVARGLVLPFTVILSSFMLHTRPSGVIVFAVGIVTFGFLLGVALDLSPGGLTTTTPTGITFGVMSSVTTALQAVVIKKSLDVVKNNAMDLAWYNNLLSSVLMVPCIALSGELPDVLELLFGTHSKQAFSTFVYGSAITGVFGFLICIAGFLSIKITSPVTHMISSAVRGVLQSLIAVWVFGDIITSGRASSISLILGGSIYYTWLKHQEQVEKERLSTSSISKLESGSYERLPMKEVEADIRKKEAQ